MKPITLYPHEIRRLLDTGSVTVWRPMKRQPRWATLGGFEAWRWECKGGHVHVWDEGRDPDEVAFVNQCAPHPPGSERWVREGWRLVAWPGDDWEALQIEYRLDNTLSPDLINTAVIKHDAWDAVEGLAEQCVDDCLKAGLNIDEPLIFDGPPPTRWRSPATMPRWASRYTVQVAGVEARQVQTIEHDEAKSAGIEGGQGPGYSFALFGFRDWWQSRYGTWNPDEWAWATTLTRKGEG